jgi:catechol 2,3-dioxygenase-like lactoylglutathione lyase family enzyme
MCQNFGPAHPIFRVADLDASLAYYENVLGFKCDWRDGKLFASVSRGKCAIFLSVGDQGTPGAWTWIGLSDATALHDEIVARGAKIRNPLRNFAWALEMQVEDLDGNVLRFGSDPLPDVPFGPWRDMHGALWNWKAEGGWERAVEGG